MTQVPTTETAVVRPALPEFLATVETMYNYETARDGFVIRKADGELHTLTCGTRTGYPMYDTRAAAQAFIDAGGLIAVEVLNSTAVIKASGWVEDEGFSDANCDRFRAYCEAQGIHCYSEEKHRFFVSEGIRQAQARGLRKLYVENLS